MRIVHVSDCYPPRMGGIETQVRDLAAAQAAAGHEVHVLTATPLEPGADPAAELLGHPAVHVHRMGLRLPFDVPVNPAAPAAMAALLGTVRPDVVHVHAGVVSPFAFDGARVALEAGAPLAITWHCMLDGVVPALRLGVRRSRWAHAPVALSAVSTAAADRVREVFGERVDLVPNGAELARWAPSDEVAPRPPVRAVATMRLAPRKRGLALIGVVEDALAQVGHESLQVDVVGTRRCVP